MSNERSAAFLAGTVVRKLDGKFVKCAYLNILEGSLTIHQNNGLLSWNENT